MQSVEGCAVPPRTCLLRAGGSRLSFVAPSICGAKLFAPSASQLSGLPRVLTQVSARPCSRLRTRVPVRMRGEETGGEDAASADDARLSRELRMKVKELYGSADNVAIQSKEDSVEFQVLRSPGGSNMSEYRSALFTVRSIVILSVIAVAGFAFLVKVGAVHDGSVTNRSYEMPVYGSKNYINPYELLEEEAPVQN